MESPYKDSWPDKCVSVCVCPTCDMFFQDSLINEKLKRTVYSKYKFCVTMYTTIQKFGVS